MEGLDAVTGNLILVSDGQWLSTLAWLIMAFGLPEKSWSDFIDVNVNEGLDSFTMLEAATGGESAN